MEQGGSKGYDNLLEGDVKQSIYRWRNSDWHILHEEVDKVFKQQVEVNQLDTNYRSDHRIIEFNNTQFEAMINTLSADFPGKEEEVKEVYSALKQKPKQEDNKGMIEVCFFEDSKDNGWQADAL